MIRNPTEATFVTKRKKNSDTVGGFQTNQLLNIKKVSLQCNLMFASSCRYIIVQLNSSIHCWRIRLISVKFVNVARTELSNSDQYQLICHWALMNAKHLAQQA